MEISPTLSLYLVLIAIFSFNKLVQKLNFYLSSYKVGNQAEALRHLCRKGEILYIPNALDSPTVDMTKKQAHIEKDLTALKSLGLKVEILDLCDYYDGHEGTLRRKVSDTGAIFISGGNVFVLRQAMFLSKLDQILCNSDLPDFLYAGYSAAGCVLSPTLASYSIVDDASVMPYKGINETIWSGLNLIPFQFLPHYKSDHPETADIDLEVAFCQENGLSYRTVSDGEVIIIRATDSF